MGTERTDLLERDRELEALERLVEEACAGRGGALLVEGPPGIGKTRLLEETRARAAGRHMVVLSARPTELEREFPFGVARQLFEPVLLDAVPERRVRLLHGAARLAALLLANQPSPEPPSTDPSLDLCHALYWLTANVAEEAPALLVVDDVHWADASSSRFLHFLLPRLEELAVLLALAARPREPGAARQPLDALATDPATEIVRPAPLSDRAVGELISSQLGQSPDGAFVEACHLATGGNPFLLGELLRQLATEGIGPAAMQAPLIEELAPPTVARAVLLRLARLGDDPSELARAVAVLGDGAPVQRAARLAGLPTEAAGRAAARLVEADILAPGPALSFAHPILRSAVYSDLDEARRSAAHRRAASLLSEEGVPADAVAVHLLATDPASDPQVVATLREAAARALQRGAAPAAQACLRRALEEPPPPAERGRILLDVAVAEFQAGETVAAVEHFEEGTRLTPDARVRAVHALSHALALQAVGRHEDAFALRERLVAEVADIEPQLARPLEASMVASARFDIGRIEWARERLERYRGARLAGQTPADRALLALQAHLDAFAADGKKSAGELAETAEAALGSGQDLVELGRGLGTPFFSAVEVLSLADRLDDARRALDAVLEDAQARGSALFFAFTSGARAMLLARQGALVEAEADAHSCAELSLPQGWFVLGPVTLGFVLEVLIQRGKLDEAEQLLEGSGMADRPADHDLTFDPVVHARARLRAARGDLTGARADLASLGRRRARWNTYSALVPPVLVAPELVGDEREAAHAQAAQMLREGQRWGTARAIGMAMRARGRLEGGARSLELLEEAARVLEPSPARIEHGWALLDLGAALRRSNRRAAARDPLRRALDLAEECGARELADRAGEELRAAGGRPRRPRLSGVDALTPSERRVAAMAADGHSNPEIAQALFVTKKTVEAHLGSAYRKLGIRSRTELAKALGG
jgi:DNA-binding CsgD family transcriptional regulator